MMHSRLIDSKDIVFSSNNIEHVRRWSSLLRLILPNRTHYQLGAEEPLEVAGYSLPASTSVDTLLRDEFDLSLQSFNAYRSRGHDGCAPEYLKRGGPVLHNWLFPLITRIWSFVSDLPVIDRIGSNKPIAKKTSSLSVDSTRPICLLTSIYKLYAILVLQKVRNRVKEFVTWTQAGFIPGRSLCEQSLDFTQSRGTIN